MRRLSLLLPLAFAACVAGESPSKPGMNDPALPPQEDACGAPALQGLVGQPASVLQTMKFGTETRVIRPGMAVTMVYLPTRLNIEINEAEVITRMSCG